MGEKFIGLLVVVAVLWFPRAAVAQNQVESLNIYPDTVYLPPEEPSCFTITGVGGAWSTVDLEYYFQNAGPYYLTGLFLDGYGQAQQCVDASSLPGQYIFTGVRITDYYWTDFVPVYASLIVSRELPPVISYLGSGCDNWDCIWILGRHFYSDSYVFVVATNWSAYQVFWGRDWGQSPAMDVGGDGGVITFQVTDPVLRYAFGNDGVYLVVVNADGSNSEWNWVHSAPPVIYGGDSGCEDPYCIWLNGVFPMNATVEFRPHGQPNALEGAYAGLTNSPSMMTLALNANGRSAYDATGLDARAVNGLFPNWSGDYYLPPKDRSVIGNVDALVVLGDEYLIQGWACARTYAGSIDVHVYVGGAAGSGSFLLGGAATQPSEPAIQSPCNAAGTHYRFSLSIPPASIQQYGGQAIYVHGLSPFGLPNYLLSGSGTFTLPVIDHAITGLILGTAVQSGQYYLQGWACAKGYADSISVHLYVGGPAGGGGAYLLSAMANQASEPAIAASCISTGTAYRFLIQLTPSLRQQYSGQPLYVYGISPYGLPNLPLGNSGLFNMPALGAISVREYIYLNGRVLAVDTTNLP